MKKILFMTALAAGILTSCSEDELTSPVSAVNNNIIAFATNKAKVTTRSGVTIKTLDKFTVNAINADKTAYFGSELYTYDTNAGVFKSQTPHYWPTTGTLDFYAINEPGAIHTIANNIPQYDYANWAAETDLVAATALAGEKEIPYPLAFKHLTSQIYVSAEAENKTEKLTYKVTSIKMTAPSSGTYSFAETSGGTGTWEIDNSSVSEYSYNEAMPRSFTQNGSIELSSLYWNILPVTTGVLHFEVQYQVLQNGKVISDNTGEHAKECIIETPNLQAGKRYIFNFVLTRCTDDEITFTTTVSEWDEGSVISPEFKEPSIPAESNPVDLGLSVNWAAGNLGADKETSIGLYYAWGETTGYTKEDGHAFTKDNYTGLSITTNLSADQDAATARLGGSWRMPTKEEFQELVNNTTKTWETIDGVVGAKFTASNGNYVFFPAGGHFSGTSRVAWQNGGGYWASTFYNTDNGSNMYVYDTNTYILYNQVRNYYGMQVRGVCD